MSCYDEQFYDSKPGLLSDSSESESDDEMHAATTTAEGFDFLNNTGHHDHEGFGFSRNGNSSSSSGIFKCHEISLQTRCVLESAYNKLVVWISLTNAIAMSSTGSARFVFG